MSSGLSVIITSDLFLREQHHLGRRIPEEEQQYSFELFLLLFRIMVSERRYKKSPFKKIFSLTISLLVLATDEHKDFPTAVKNYTWINKIYTADPSSPHHSGIVYTVHWGGGGRYITSIYNRNKYELNRRLQSLEFKSQTKVRTWEELFFFF
jgi:hypothetical protein